MSDGWGYPAGYADSMRPGKGVSVAGPQAAPARTRAAPGAPRTPAAVALGLARSLRSHCAEGSLGRQVADILAARCMDEIRTAERRRRR